MARWQHRLVIQPWPSHRKQTIFRLLCSAIKFGKVKLVFARSLAYKLSDSLELEMSGKKKAKNNEKPGKSFNCDQCDKVTIKFFSILM